MVQRIWDFTSGHPEVVKRLCQRMIIRLKRGSLLHLYITDVEAVITNPDFLLHDFLDTYWERATFLERLCTLIMAVDDCARTLSTVQKALRRHEIDPSLQEVESALKRLVDLRNILRPTSDGYDFSVTAFPGIISKFSPKRLDDIIALNCEGYRRHEENEADHH